MQRALTVFFDLETTGLSTTHDKIVQICARAYNGNLDSPLGGFHAFVHPGRAIPFSSSRVHGIYVSKKGLLYHKAPGTAKEEKPTFLPDARAWHQVAPSFINWILIKLIKHNLRTVVFAGHNVQKFDLPMLLNELRRAPGRPSLKGVRVRVADTLPLCREYIRNIAGEKGFYKLGNLHQHFFHCDISTGTGLPAHDARADVLANVRVAASQPSVRQACLHGAAAAPEAQQELSLGGDWTCALCGSGNLSKYFAHKCPPRGAAP